MNTQPNKFRGEYQFELGGRLIPLRASYDNVARAETAIKKSVEAMTINAQLMNIPLSDVTKCIWALSHNKGSSPYTEATIGDWILDGGQETKIKAYSVAISLMSGIDPDSISDEPDESEKQLKEEIKEYVEEAHKENPEKKSRTRSKPVTTKQ